jgi:hypothetical protein
MSNRTAEIAAARAADEQIAAAWAEYYKVATQLATAKTSLKDATKRMARASYNRESYQEDVSYYEARVEKLQAEAKDLRTIAVELNQDLYKGWTRFFLVKHIHSSQYCSSFRPTTQVGWLPNLSGQTEAEAVAEHGAILCTICYPTAPVAWTEGKKEDGICAGSGQYYNADKPTGRERSYYSPTGTCSTCDKTVGLTARNSTRVRKHKVTA